MASAYDLGMNRLWVYALNAAGALLLVISCIPVQADDVTQAQAALQPQQHRHHQRHVVHHSHHANKASSSHIGLASYYGPGLQGNTTASGETFDKNQLVAAHPTYPLGTNVRVTNLRNGRAVTVKVVDRGPTPANRAKGVIIDVSEGAAKQLGFRSKGKTRVKTEAVDQIASDH